MGSSRLNFIGTMNGSSYSSYFTVLVTALPVLVVSRAGCSEGSINSPPYYIDFN